MKRLYSGKLSNSTSEVTDVEFTQLQQWTNLISPSAYALIEWESVYNGQSVEVELGGNLLTIEMTHGKVVKSPSIVESSIATEETKTPTDTKESKSVKVPTV